MELIQGKTGIAPSQQRLLCGVKWLRKPHRSLEAYGVPDHATVHLKPALLGGASGAYLL